MKVQQWYLFYSRRLLEERFISTVDKIMRHPAAVVHKPAVMLAYGLLTYIKTCNARWSVARADFYPKHKFFEDQYKRLDEFMDDIAERIRSVGYYAPTILKKFLQLSCAKTSIALPLNIMIWEQAISSQV